MRVLMLSLDRTLLDANALEGGDSLHRHATYARWLAEDEPGGALHVLARTAPADPARTLRVGALAVHAVPTPRWALAARMLDVGLRLARAERFDLVSSQTPFDDGAAALAIGRLRGLPVNIQMRSSFLNNPWWIAHKPVAYRAFNALGRAVSKRADTIRLISEGECRRLAALHPDLQRKLFVLPPMINRGVLDEGPGAAEVERRPDGVLFVGRLSWEKNVTTLLEACGLLRARGVSVSIDMVGHGPLRKQLESRATELGLDHLTRWHGPLPMHALASMYRAATVTVLPSFYEGFGKVIVESYLCGTPVVTAPVVSAPELIRHGETGFILSRADDPAGLADHLHILLGDRARARAMGAAGRQLVQTYLPSQDDHRRRQLGIWRATAARSAGHDAMHPGSSR